jgi:hypothetical protein
MNEPKSWTEVLKNREIQNKTLPWDPEKVPKVEKISLYEV